MTEAEKAYALELADVLNAAAELLMDDIDAGQAGYAQIEKVIGSLAITIGGVIAQNQRQRCGSQ